MIAAALIWWLVSVVLGIAAFPAAYRVFDRLPDRGFGLSRALGILGAGYLFWLGGSVGLLRNDAGAAVLGVVALGGIAAAASGGRWRESWRWVAENWRTALVFEILFAAAFAWWAFVRANNPEIAHTEKPMELAFLNAILRSDSFPPFDPWLSGHAISYYHFGYILLGFLSRLTGTTSGIAFNLGNALWFALTASGAYSILYNLLSGSRVRRLAGALLGPLFVLITGNLEGVLEVLHARHVFWRAGPDGALTSPFWAWLNIGDLVNPPTAPPSWMPERFWVWWQASRVVNDVDLRGVVVGAGPIDEFPYFSFLLADNHPHLLALPFVLLAIAFALQIFAGGARAELRIGVKRAMPDWLRGVWLAAALILLVAAGIRAGATIRAGLGAGEAFAEGLKTLAFGAAGVGLLSVFGLLIAGALPSGLTAAEFWTAGWMFGALAFLNTWDWPIYLSLLLGVLAWAGRADRPSVVAGRIASTGAGLLAAGVLFFLPWYPAFSSQAGGILPNLAFPTRLPHFLIMFGTSFVPILAWLLWRAWPRRQDWRLVAAVALGVPAALLLISWLLGAAALVFRPDVVASAVESFGAPDVRGAISGVLVRRLLTSWTALLLGLLLALAALALLRRAKGASETNDDRPWPFIVLMAILGALLVIGPEFLYLKDLFGVRMNTVFKFYFAAWILWGLGAAYVVTELWPRRWSWGGVLRAGASLTVVLGLFYTVTATWSKVEGFRPVNGRTLDGTAHLSWENPGDYAAIQWMNASLQPGVVAEAVGGSYSYGGRVSVHTGFPTVLGWPWHEVQWRGDARFLGSREDDIRRLFQSRDWIEAEAILSQYGIEYVFVGDFERGTYGPIEESMFASFMDVVYVGDGVTIYAVRDTGRGE